MVRCPKCGADNSDKQEFCFWCGAALSRVKAPKTEVKEAKPAEVKEAKPEGKPALASSEPEGGGRGKLIAGVAAVVVVVVGVVAAILLMGGGAYDTPEATITSFTNAWNAYNTDAAWNCLSTQMQSTWTKDDLNTGIIRDKNRNAQLSGIQISNVNISGDNATATVSYTYSSTSGSRDESTTFYLIKEGGQWKINDIGGLYIAPVTVRYGSVEQMIVDTELPNTVGYQAADDGKFYIRFGLGSGSSTVHDPTASMTMTVRIPYYDNTVPNPKGDNEYTYAGAISGSITFPNTVSLDNASHAATIQVSGTNADGDFDPAQIWQIRFNAGTGKYFTTLSKAYVKVAKGKSVFCEGTPLFISTVEAPP